MHNQLTRNDIKRMEEEIEYRKLVVRKEALEAVKEARAQGDLSENFEYYAAKREKNKNESRIRFLERMKSGWTIRWKYSLKKTEPWKPIKLSLPCAETPWKDWSVRNPPSVRRFLDIKRATAYVWK